MFWVSALLLIQAVNGKEKAFIISHTKGAAKAVVMSLDDDGIRRGLRD